MKLQDLDGFLTAPLSHDNAAWLTPAIILAILVVVFAKRDAILPGLLLGALAVLVLG